MAVAEPWDFPDPVRLKVKDRPSDNRWIVVVLSGWADATEASLMARYYGETLLPLGEGQEVIVNLTATDRPIALVGTVRAETAG